MLKRSHHGFSHYTLVRILMYDLPACTWLELKNQYPEPAPRSPVLFCLLWLYASNDMEYHAFQESESHACLKLSHDYYHSKYLWTIMSNV